MTYDVAIIGLGPAGATLARLLPPSVRVLALDKKSADPVEAGFRKPCGGLLAPDAQKALARLGLTLPVEILVDPQIFSVRTIDIPTGLVRHYQRFYLNLDRHKFDLWLGALIPNWVDVRHNARCCGIRQLPEGWQITWRENGGEETATARFLVGADGANSRVRRLLYPDAKIRTYLSIQQVFEDVQPSPSYCCVFDPAATDCYAWGLSKNDRFIFGGAFPLDAARERFAGLKEKLRGLGFALNHPLETQACKVLRPLGRQHFLGNERAFLIGEAAGLISPSSLEGISYALNSAVCLAKAFETDTIWKHYRRFTRHMRGKLLGKNLKTPFMYRPTLRHMVMASGLKSIKVQEQAPSTP